MVEFNGSNAYQMRYEEGAAEKKKQQPEAPEKKRIQPTRREDRWTRARFVCSLPEALRSACLSRSFPLSCDATPVIMS